MSARRLVTGLLAAAAVTLTVGCTEGDWRYEAPPAAGLQTDSGDAKVRNLLIVSDESGQGILLGAVATNTSDTVTTITLAPHGAQDAEPTIIDINEKVTRNNSLTLEPETTKFEAPGLELGRTADVLIEFKNGQAISMEAPVYSSEHPDFAETWSEVNV